MNTVTITKEAVLNSEPEVTAMKAATISSESQPPQGAANSPAIAKDGVFTNMPGPQVTLSNSEDADESKTLRE
jgi:hypothetical protein